MSAALEELLVSVRKCQVPGASRVPVYVAGPYASAAEDPLVRATEIRRNVDRATALGQHVTRLGFAPIVPHVLGWAGLHGSPREDDESTRPVALECGVALAETVAKAQGQLWVITRDDGTMSSGTQLEYNAFRAAAPTVYGLRLYTWPTWREEIDWFERCRVQLDAAK